MYYEAIQKHKTKVKLAGILFIFLIIAWGIITFVERNGKTALTIRTVPSDAIITVNDKRIGNGTHWLRDASYTIKVEKDGFDSQERDIDVSQSKEQNVAAVSLTPNSDEAKKWADEHAIEYSKNEQYGAIEASSNGKYFAEKNPITKKLPFTDPYFKIGYKVDDDKSIVLTIDTPSPRYRFYAIEKIRELGYDPTDFVIQFEDFKNPLEQS